MLERKNGCNLNWCKFPPQEVTKRRVPKESRRKLWKIKVEIKEIRNTHTIKKTDKVKAWFFENTDKTDRPPPRLIEKKKERRHASGMKKAYCYICRGKQKERGYFLNLMPINSEFYLKGQVSRQAQFIKMTPKEIEHLDRHKQKIYSSPSVLSCCSAKEGCKYILTTVKILL